MARSARDLELLLDVIAGPDEPIATAYRLALPPPRRNALKDFRVLVLDDHPLLPTAASVRGAVERLADQLVRTGAKVARSSPLLPDMATAGRVYAQLLYSFFAADMPIDRYRRIQELAAGLPADDMSMAATRLRGFALGHREWVGANRVRAGVSQRWREFFREWDVVVCPNMPTPAFPHDHTPEVYTAHLDRRQGLSLRRSGGVGGRRDIAGTAGDGGALRAYRYGIACWCADCWPLSRGPHYARLCQTGGGRVWRIRPSTRFGRVSGFRMGQEFAYRAGQEHGVSDFVT